MVSTVFFFVIIVTNISGNVTEIKNNISEKGQINSQNSAILSYSSIKQRKDTEAYGGVSLSFDNGVLKPKNIISIDSYQPELTQNELDRKNRIYVIQSGDNIFLIAKKFKVSEKTIIIENELKSNLIKPGKELTILPISGVSHKVVKGDTILGLSKEYKVKEENIVDFNNLGGELMIGDVVIIPDGDKSINVNKNYIPNYKTNNAENYNGYVISARGDRYERYSSKTNYGYYTHPVPGSFRVRGITSTHKGVDMAAPTGTPILAAASGTVIKAASTGWNQGCGQTVYLQHPNGSKTLYCHSSKILVATGQYVVKGQKIAEIGSTGNSTGPHLHLEVRNAVNPF